MTAGGWQCFYCPSCNMKLNYCWNVVSAVFLLVLALAVAFGSMVASRNLHTGLLTQVMRCPMSFFDTTPLGRIVNRFSKDIDILDTNIPQFAQNFLITFAPLVSTIIIISYSTPIFIAVAIPLILIFIVIQVTKKIKEINVVIFHSSVEVILCSWFLQLCTPFVQNLVTYGRLQVHAWIDFSIATLTYKTLSSAGRLACFCETISLYQCLSS